MSGSEWDAGNRKGKAGRTLIVWLLGLTALALGANGLAPALRADDAGPAARAVRLSNVDGQVQISQGNNVLADTAVANTPLFEGTRLITADDGRAEIQFEDGSVARLSPNSSLTLTVLRGSGANGEAEITLNGGLGYVEVQGGGQSGTMRVKFGDSVVTASGFTVMRINLDNPPGELAVFSGNAHLERGAAVTVDLHGGESVALNAASPSLYTLNETIEPDSWDSWNSDRDQVLTSEAATATGATKDYGQANNPAWNDLDANGNWYNVPGEGQIWSPYEASNPGWDPYGNGNWMYNGGFGYTWISGYPWGYMPYSCGMWNWYDTFGWGWAPGMNGCLPWWGGGYPYGYGYGVNIGRGFTGYRPPLRPHPPRHPLSGTRLIAVNRHVQTPNITLPPRDRTSMVQIAGHAVLPMRPITARPTYSRTASGFVNGTAGVGSYVRGVPSNGPARVGGPTFAPGRPGTTFSPGTGNSGVRNSGGGQRAPSGGSSSAGHVSSGGSGGGARSGGGGFSGGGGGGGGAHVGGGGGGGGGGSHH